MSTGTVSSAARRRWILITVGVGTFMSALDGSVVNTILPFLGRELRASVAGVEWVTTIYLLAVSALLLGVGRAGDLYGHKIVYLGGFVVFVIGSALSGASSDVRMLIGMRALQAVGAAMIFANSPAILTKSFPAEQRGRALGAQAMFTYLGLTAGPSLGGWLAQALSWRAVFYINVPIGILAIALTIFTVERDTPERITERFDFAGAALFTIGLTALLVALNQGHARGWASPPIIGLFAAAVLLLGGFIVFERRRASPMLDLTLFRSRVFSASTAAALFNYICVYALVFVLPFLLIQGRGMNTQQAGLLLTAQPIVMAIVAPIAGAMSDRIGSRPLAVAGMFVLALGLLVLGRVSPHGAIWQIALWLAVVGFGVGLFTSPNNSALMGAAPRHRQGIAAGVLASARNVGMVLGVGIAGAIFMQYGVVEALYTASALAVVGAVISMFTGDEARSSASAPSPRA